MLFVFCGSHGGSEDGEYNIASSHRRIFLVSKMNMKHHKRKAAALPSGIICSDWLEGLRNGKVYHINHFKQIDLIFVVLSSCVPFAKAIAFHVHHWTLQSKHFCIKYRLLYGISAHLIFLTRFFRAKHRPSKKRKV